ncbi:hypothetical protein LINPERHAP1_LOCUS12147 [Linum perenne]
MSRTRRRKRGAAVWGRTMQTIEKGRDNTREIVVAGLELEKLSEEREGFITSPHGGSCC